MVYLVIRQKYEFLHVNDPRQVRNRKYRPYCCNGTGVISQNRQVLVSRLHQRVETPNSTIQLETGRHVCKTHSLLYTDTTCQLDAIINNK